MDNRSLNLKIDELAVLAANGVGDPGDIGFLTELRTTLVMGCASTGTILDRCNERKSWASDEVKKHIAASILGSLATEKKAKASAENGAKGGRPIKRVQLVNPWSGSLPPDRNYRWADITAWAKDHVHPDDMRAWLREARSAFRDDDGDALGVMIIGS